jgi:predicted transcriptional regulator of viral defense system
MSHGGMMVTQNIQFGPKETKFLFTLEEEGRSIFTADDANRILGSGHSSSLSVISGLKKKGRIREIQKGRYLLIPARAGIEGYWAEEAYVIIPYLIEEYYIGFWTAMNFWGMTEQIPHTVFVVTPKRKKRRVLEFGNQRYEFVTLSRKKFFGFVEEKTAKTKFNISSKEKTIVDGLMHPQYCGGIPEVTKVMWNARKEVNWKTVLEMTERTGVNVVLRRLGYMLETLEIETVISKLILKQIKQYPYHYLDPTAIKKKIEYSNNYGLIINITKNELLGWRDH